MTAVGRAVRREVGLFFCRSGPSWREVGPFIKAEYFLEVKWLLLASEFLVGDLIRLEEKLVSFLTVFELVCLVWKRSWSLSLLFGNFC